MTKTERNCAIWSTTLEIVHAEQQFFTRTELNYVRDKFETNLHAVLHRAGEVNTDGEF